VTVDIQRQIPASFDRVQRNDYGYNAKQVDQFLQRARVSFENPHAAAEVIKSADVRAVSFDPVKGGYAAAGVDAALDRLEDAFARRERDDLIAARAARTPGFVKSANCPASSADGSTGPTATGSDVLPAPAAGATTRWTWITCATTS
jgi:DivIVA domain-containing protein